MQKSPNLPNELSSILVKPAGPDCNLRCAYCFYRKKEALFSTSPDLRMSEKVMERIVRQMTALPAPHLSFGWQGGEPTLMGLSFFEKIIDAQIRLGRGKIIGNSLQTNGLLLDAHWARFLRRYRFLVGLSLDGPREVHDAHRLDASGKGSWERASDTARRLLDNGVEVNALCVVTAHSAKSPEEIYTFLKDLGLHHQQYIPCLEPSPIAAASPYDLSVTPDAFGSFLCRLFDLWLCDLNGPHPVSIRFFESVLNQYLGADPSDCSLLPACGVYLVVEHNGDVFPCDFFVSENLRLGNVMTGSLEEMFVSPAMGTFRAAKSTLPAACAACPWVKLCNGGCPKDRPRVEGICGRSFFCDAYRTFFAHAHRAMKGLAERLTRSSFSSHSKPCALSKKAVGRNEPCPCGSGRKFKKCCLVGN